MITVVSGLPRSGTSLMMQMLRAGGMPILSDEMRGPDQHNPRGYLEYQKVRSLATSSDWIVEAEGRAVKVVSQLLYHLPPTCEYQMIFMQRDLDEVLLSQEKMLSGLSQPSGPDRSLMKQHFQRHLDALNDWLSRQSHFRRMDCSFRHLLRSPSEVIPEILDFLNIPLSQQQMLEAIDPALYRQRTDSSTL